MCGKSFILQKRIFEGQINKAPTRYKNKKTHDEIMFEIRNK